MNAIDHGARPPYCESCGYKHVWTATQVQWYVQQVRRLHGAGHPYQEYPCPVGNGWHVRSKDDDMRVAAGYTVPPQDGRPGRR
ncbi:MAG TPA: hypothetical protein VHC49_02335 [Mycobacteriales bacterium]|nr:hypothetical protein [Mycobacteriales bacterium]